MLGRSNSIQVPCNLSFQIRNSNKLLKDIFGHDISVSSFFDIVRIYVNIFGSQVQISGRNRSNSPVSVTSKLLLFVRI